MNEVFPLYKFDEDEIIIVFFPPSSSRAGGKEEAWAPEFNFAPELQNYEVVANSEG